MALYKKKMLFIIIGVITLAAFLIVLALLLNIQVLKPQIEAAASSALGMDIRIKGRIGIDLFPDLAISLKDVSGQNGGAEVLSIERMTIRTNLIPLMKRDIKINRIGVIRPVFSIVRDKKGTFNFDQPGRTQSGRFLAVKEIAIAQGRLVYTDEKSGEKIEANDFELTIRNLTYSSADSAELFKNISFSGDGSCKMLKIKNLVVTNLVMKTAAGKGIGEINPVNMNMFGGTGEGSIAVDMTGNSPQYRILYALDRFRIEDILQGYSAENISREIMEGLTDFSADVTAAGNSANDLKRSLNGIVSLTGENLMLNYLDIDAIIQEYEQSQNVNLLDVGAFFLAGPFGPALTKSYNSARLYQESKGGKGIIRKLVSVWNIKDGLAAATDVAFASQKHRIALKGGLDLINEQFVDTTIAVLDKGGCAVYSQNMSGPFRNPHTEKASIVTSLAGPLLNALDNARKFLQDEACPVFYSGSVAHPGG